MAGAYVAKPADAVVGPVVPPGWNDNWPPPGATDSDYPGIDPDPFFPAPYPPGYEPEFSLVMTATAEISYSGTASVTGSVRDHDTYVTNEPSAITWTAAIDGTAVSLRFSGDEDYETSLSSSVAFSTYWGAAPSIGFELTEDNEEDTLVLTGVSTISGETITETVNINIVATRYSVVLTAILSAGYSYGFVGHIRVRADLDRDSDGDRTFGEILYQDGLPDIEQSTDELDEASVVTNATGQDVGEDSVIITSTGLNENEIYDITGQIDGYRPDASGTARILITEEISSTVIYDHTSSLAVSDPLNHATDTHRVELDTSDGSYTVLAS